MKFKNFKAFSLLAIVTLMTFTLVHPSSHHHNHKRNTHRTRAAGKQESEKEIRARKNSNSLFFSFSCFNGKLLRSCKYEEEKFSCASKRAWIFLPSNFLNRFHIFIFSALPQSRLLSFSLLFFLWVYLLFDCHLGVQLKIVLILQGHLQFSTLTFASRRYHYCLNIQRFFFFLLLELAMAKAKRGMKIVVLLSFPSVASRCSTQHKAQSLSVWIRK